MVDRLRCEGGPTQHSPAGAVRPALRKCRRLPVARQGCPSLGHRSSEPVRFLGGLARILGLQEQVAKFFIFLPRLFVAMFIFFFGLLAASFFARAVLLASVNANVPSPRFLSQAVRTIIIIFVLSIVFEELGLAEQTMLVAFGIAFGALMLGLAIAFGLGGQDLAQSFLERRFLRTRKEESEDELSPL
jgi:signal transduction histidine kinase